MSYGLRLRGLVAWFVVFVVAVAEVPAWAAPTSKLTYVRGPGAEACADETELRKAVAHRLGYDPFFPWAERTVVAQIDASAKGFRGQVRIIDGTGKLLGQRVLDAPARDCGELVKSLALAISVAIDDLEDAAPEPSVAPAQQPAQAEVAPEPLPPRAEPSPEPDRVSPAPANPSAPRLFTTAGLLASVQSAPAPTLGATLGVGVRLPRWSTALEGRADLPASDTLTGGGRVSTHLLVGSIVPCVRVQPFSFCAVGSLGAFFAQADDVAIANDGSALYLAAGARVAVDIPIADWASAYIALDVAATLRRHRLQLDGTNVYELPPTSESLGVGFRFGSRN